jgi:hypothetical protein
MDRKIRRINPIAKALATNRRRTQMVESKKLYSRKDERDIFKEIEQESHIPDEEIPIDDEEIEEYLK